MKAFLFLGLSLSTQVFAQTMYDKIQSKFLASKEAITYKNIDYRDFLGKCYTSDQPDAPTTAYLSARRSVTAPVQWQGPLNDPNPVKPASHAAILKANDSKAIDDYWIVQMRTDVSETVSQVTPESLKVTNGVLRLDKGILYSQSGDEVCYFYEKARDLGPVKAGAQNGRKIETHECSVSYTKKDIKKLGGKAKKYLRSILEDRGWTVKKEGGNFQLKAWSSDDTTMVGEVMARLDTLRTVMKSELSLSSYLISSTDHWTMTDPQFRSTSVPYCYQLQLNR